MKGDIILFNEKPKNILLRLFAKMEDTIDGDGSGYSPTHAGIVIDEFGDYVETLENLNQGITRRKILVKDNPHICIMRLKNTVDFTETINKFKKEVGEPYGWFALFSAGLTATVFYLEKPIGKLFNYEVKKRKLLATDKLKICSELVRNFYLDKNIYLKPINEDILSPCDLYYRNLDQLKIIKDFEK